MELIKIYQGNLIDARELHQFLEVKTKFSMWIDRTLVNQFSENKDFFPKVGKSTGGRQSKEFLLTLDTAKKLSMMAKTPKGAEARNYFLECEKAIVQLRQNKRLEAFLKLETTKGRLAQNIIDLGGTKTDYIQIDTAGSKVFFNGQVIKDEELSMLALKGRDFATEITNDIISSNIHKLEDVEDINKQQHGAVRDFLIDQTGKKPEELPREDTLKKLNE